MEQCHLFIYCLIHLFTSHLIMYSTCDPSLISLDTILVKNVTTRLTLFDSDPDKLSLASCYNISRLDHQKVYIKVTSLYLIQACLCLKLFLGVCLFHFLTLPMTFCNCKEQRNNFQKGHKE